MNSEPRSKVTWVGQGYLEKPFFLSNVGDSDCSFVVILMNFEPACCRIDHSDTFAYQVFLSFSAYGIWANEINAHLIPRYCFCYLFWEVSKCFGSSAFIYLTSRADCHLVCDLILHFWPPKVLTNDFLDLILYRDVQGNHDTIGWLFVVASLVQQFCHCSKWVLLFFLHH